MLFLFFSWGWGVVKTEILNFDKICIFLFFSKSVCLPILNFEKEREKHQTILLPVSDSVGVARVGRAKSMA